MKNRGVFFCLVLGLAILGLFIACKGDPGGTENPPVIVPGTTINEKIRWLETNVQSDNRYIIEVEDDQNIAPAILSYSGKYNIIITLIGIGSERIVSLSGNGSITVGNNVTLILDDNIELRGRSSNNSPLIRVESNAHLIMNSGAKVTGNSSSSGGGVTAGGNFTMNGGEISGNTGGVYINSSRAIFTMNGGRISGNTSSRCGGVYVYGNFTMNGGEISGNTSTSYGGGVYVSYGNFTMNGGEISGNTVSSTSTSSGGGGVCVDATLDSPSFRKTGGTIAGYSIENNDSNVVKDNNGVVQSNRGHAIYAYWSEYGRRKTMSKENTSGPEDNLSFNGRTPPSWSGEWDY